MRENGREDREEGRRCAGKERGGEGVGERRS